MSDVPSNLIPTRITGLPEYLGTSTLGYLPYVIEGNTYKVQFANIAAVGAVPSTREINTGSGLGGGGDLSANRTLYILPGGVDDSRLTTTGVTAGTYGAADSVPVLTINAQGRVTGVTNTPIVLSGYVPTSRTITAGAGLTGGGDLSANRSFAVNFSSTTPEPLGPGSPGVSTVAARGDHVHPAVDLSDTTETQGVLPLSRGGTGNSLSPVVGAIAYSSNDRLNLTPTSGNAGDVLVSAGGLAPPFWQAPIGGGTVTSINASGGTTGMSFTGGPITVSGTLTLGGTLGVANGGTGATDAATALTNLGAYPASNPAGYTSNVGTVTSVSGTGTVSGLSLSGTVTSAGSLTLGGTLVVTPSDFASQSANTVLAAPNGSAGVPTFRAIVAADIPTLNQNTTGTASNVTGIVAVANGGTGASVAGTARTNLSAAASGANTDITSIALTTGTISTSPTSGTDIVNKTYADSIASGINFHQSVRLATAAALPANTYNNGTSGVGATLTANANGALSVDSVAAVVGNRILVKNEVAQANNGVYTVTQVGDGSTPYILTRATDFDSAGTGVDQIDAGDFFLVTAGSTQSNTSWVQQTPLPITVGTTAIVFTQFAAPVLYSAGTGLTLAGTVFSITNTGVSASTYGSASSVPVLAINAQGQVTSASSSSIAIAASQITSGTVSVAQGGTGATTLTANGVLLGNGTSAISATAVGSTGQVLVGNTGGAPSWATLSGIGVTSFSAGTTGLTPSSATTGAITLAGTLNVANGGTGTNTTFTAGSVVFAGASGVYTQDNANLFWDNSNDRLGIGTATPSVPLDVTENGVNSGLGYSNVSKIVDGSGNKGLLIGYDNSAQTTVLTANSTAASSNMTFWTYEAGGSGWAERMRVASSGNVGIGTSSPGSALQVNGNIRVSNGTGFVTANSLVRSIQTMSGSANQFVSSNIDFYTAAFTDNGQIAFSTGGAEAMRINGSSNVGIGTSSPSSRLTITGGTTEIRDGNYLMLRPVGNAWDMRLQATGTQLDILSGGALGSPIMSLVNGGNVGIGTSSPTTRLQIGDIGATDATFQGRIKLEDTSASLQAVGGLEYATSSFGAGYGWKINSIDSSGVHLVFGTRQNSATWTETMRIDSSGNVGIGTSSPASLLHASGVGSELRSQNTSTTQFQSGRVRLKGPAGTYRSTVLTHGNNNTGGTNTYFSIDGADSSDNYLQTLALYDYASQFWGFSTNGSERMRITSVGLVGIGTSAPNHTLDVTGNVGLSGNIYMGQGFNNGNSIEVGYGRTGSNFAYIDLIGDTTYSDYGFRMLRGNNGANANSQLSHRGTGAFVLIAEEAAPIAFQTSSTERARISTDGYLLVGTTAPLGGNTSNEYKTTTAGSWPLTLNANDRGLLIRQSAASSGIYAYFEYNGGTNNGQISWSGGTTSYTTTSDARVKKNIVDAPDAGSLIDTIKVRSWDFKADDVHWRYGMVAQELLPVAPEAVTVPEDKEMMMGVDYAKLVPMLVKEIQSLRARVAQLEGN